MKITVKTPFLRKNQEIILLGETEVLGNWQAGNAVRLQQKSYTEWTTEIDISQALEYKFAVYDSVENAIVKWEDGFNRRFPNAETRRATSLQMQFRWNNWRAAGVAIPVFSLRSEKSFGIGEFSDLKLMVDWAAKTNMTIIQILPVNDTIITHTWTDSYPYNAISIYALNPAYLGLSEFPLKNKTRLKKYLQKAKELNALPEIDFEAVLKLKEAYLHDLFAEKSETVLKSKKYKKFFDDNCEWLFPYSCFTFFRDKFNTADHNFWNDFSKYDKAKLEQEILKNNELKTAVDLAYFTQYLLHEQLFAVREYAHQNGVVLKGDIPIGVSRAGVETWVEPQLFNLDAQTGAPPDDFSVTGQNWGFPTYNWDEMAKDGYQWWQKRFRKMADYFDAYRIDHILGFFRIWEIPMKYQQGLMGCFSPAKPFSVEEIRSFGFPFDEKMSIPDTDADSSTGSLSENVLFIRDRKDTQRFHPRITAQTTAVFKSLPEKEQEAYNRLYEVFFYHRHNDFWREQAMKKLPVLLSSTNMLACGEDLGMIPTCVPLVMNELQIISLEIQRMPKELYVKFTNLNNIPYRSVCTTSTHDMSPLRAWWREDKATTQQYFNEILWMQGDAPTDCTPELCKQILKNHLNSPAMLVIIPLQDWLSISEKLRRENPDEERINIPANPRHYWRYRMHLTLEKLIDAEDFNREIQEMIDTLCILSNEK